MSSRLLPLMIMATAAGQSCCGSQPDEVSFEKLCDHVKKRQSDVQCVSYAVKGVRTWLQGSFAESPDEVENNPNPEADLSADFTRSIVLDFSQNRHRAEWDNPEYDFQSKSIYRIQCVEACDGSTVYSRILKNENPMLRQRSEKKHVDLLIQTGELPGGIFMSSDFLPLLIGHGSLCYGPHKVTPGRLITTREFPDLSLIREDEHQGKKCSVLGTAKHLRPQTEVWLCHEFDDSVVRVAHISKRPFLTHQIDYARHDGHWLVARWQTEQRHVADDRLLFQETAEINRVNIRPPLSNAESMISEEPGMYVEREQYAHDGTKVTVQEQFYHLETSGQRSELEKSSLTPKYVSNSRTWLVFFSVISTAIVAVACVMVGKRR